MSTSREIERVYKLNVGLSPLDENGKLNEAEHAERVKPIYAHIKGGLDGLTMVFVGQHHVRVKYWSHVTTAAEVDAHIKASIAWADAELESLFPLRDTKTVTVTLDMPEPPEPRHQGRLYVNFGSNITEFPVSATTEGWDDELFRATVEKIAKQMTNFDGIQNYELRMRTASFTFDTRIANRSTLERFLRDVIQSAAAGDEFFPFAHNVGEIEPVFEYTES